MIQLKVENLRLEEDSTRLENEVSRYDVRIKDLDNELDKFLSKAQVDES